MVLDGGGGHPVFFFGVDGFTPLHVVMYFWGGLGGPGLKAASYGK